MRALSAFLCLVFVVSPSVSSHYIFNTLIAGNQVSRTAVRVPQNNSPIQPVRGSVDSPYLRCNVDPFPATSTVNIAAGSVIGFKSDVPIYHSGPAAIYLGKVPPGQTAASWDGSGPQWFKVRKIFFRVPVWALITWIFVTDCPLGSPL
ncbi:hypothetical protein H0H81_004974 [Sphagnurus paluster]|uniref:AA9 family lytic polysaccharide monooxygenase n=1 Tax=Sphagnurus paluster TaxID=117069 RepID=A0A9P7FSI8_9AGAR|nr:hypothetical protein H0H81_004974 [Sphagnurus paluster]